MKINIICIENTILLQNSWEKSTREEGVPFFAHYNEYRKKRERELINQISSKDAVVDERIPTVDHARFRERFKQDDKQEFAELFEGDEDYTESFKKVLEGGGEWQMRCGRCS